MTDEIGWASLGIVPTLDRGFGSSLSRQLDPGLAGVARSSGAGFGKLLGKAAVAGAAGIIGAGFAAFKLGSSAIAEARESQKVAALTASTIKATGGAANVSAKYIDKLSYALGKKAGVDDEVVGAGLNMLLSFKEIRNEAGRGNKIFKQAAKATSDYAAAVAAASGGQADYASASVAVGKALNDPVGGITALKKKGVDFTESQKEQIKALVEAGRKMDAQKIILRELKSEFGGAAESQRTMGDQVSFAWGNIQEELGNVLLPLVDKAERAFLKKGVPAIEAWVDVFGKKGVPALKHFYDKALPIAEDVLPKVGDVLGTIKDDLVIAAPYARDFVNAFLDMPDWAKKAIVGGGLAAVAGKKLGLGGLLGGLGKGAGSLVSKSKPVPVLVVNEGFGGGGGGVGGKLTAAGGTLRSAGGPIAGLTAVALAAYLFNKKARSDGRAEQLDQTARENEQKNRDQAVPDYVPADYGMKPGSPWSNAIDELNKQIDEAARRKIQPTFEILGLVEANAKVAEMRARAAQAIHVPVIIDGPDGLAHSTAGGHEAAVPGERRQRGVTVNIGKMVAHDYKDMNRQLQQRSQQAAIGGIGVFE